MVSIQCVLGEGELPVKINWLFNEMRIEPHENGVIINSLGSRISNLMIESVNERHIGNYTCLVQNRAGSDKFSAYLEVIGTSCLITSLSFNLFSQHNNARNLTSLTFQFFLHLAVPPKISPFTFGDTPMNFGDTVSVQCTISGGDTPINVIWKLNHEKIPDNLMDILLEKRGQRVHTLFIESVTHKHIGNYSCSATNKAGTVDMVSELRVNGWFKY